MKGVEGFEGLGANHTPESIGIPVGAPEVQAALALCEYREKHKNVFVDPAHWDQNDEGVRNAAMMEWVGDLDDPASGSARYRAYVQEHPSGLIDIANNEALQELLLSLAEPEGKPH